MDTAAGIRGLVRKHNGERWLEAVVEFGLGVLFSLITFGGVFWLSWLVVAFRSDAVLIAGTITVVCAVLSFLAAWKKVNPLQDIEPMTDAEFAMTMISIVGPGTWYFSPKRAMAGLLLILFAGPANLLAVVASLRRRLPASESGVQAATATLRDAAARDLPVDSVNRDGLVLLFRLRLVKAVGGDGGQVHLRITEKGRDLVFG